MAPNNGKLVVGILGLVIIAFAIAALATEKWMKSGSTDYGLFEIQVGSTEIKIKDIDCLGGSACEEFVRKTKASSALMLIGLFCTIVGTIGGFLNHRIIGLIGAGLAALFYFLTLCVYGSIDRDSNGTDADLKASFGLAIICLLLSCVMAAASFFMLNRE
eukprot:m.46988 g.46988  ORF g.46988 m.46988 type:complete len:160 (-) comp12595_c0_seq1:1519-1998(-)